ncbi:tRNA synthetases class I (C) catalytic domain-containing protein [Fimicolochytrium jonesii]|uniref:tRNA synthetases class I (C) catalytic domain-containing protein n=1 Tax=Fimicolochytrium jonesii TaxID=1396493 RepID=UPI0022FE45ED|nr:tRNA synthetases class I (C) catalytic domain-containing protein [Fimicolochytrium jonesii]KAI8818285.1 tRNA synthetases class I (C) catalytic domain-containing protein [Fimicolochytrium jonesii]
MSSNPIKQPQWHKPQGSETPRLRVNNSMTKSKEDFIPINGNKVGWYCCGPTVYDFSHMGHARCVALGSLWGYWETVLRRSPWEVPTYIAFDIIRRIMEDYFKYDVFYVMNITDIDDKIIKEARFKYLFDRLRNETKTLSPSLLETVEAAWRDYSKSKFKAQAPASIEEYAAFLAKYEGGGIPEAKEEAKYDLFVKTAGRSAKAITVAREQIKSGSSSVESAHALLDESRDIVAAFLDVKEGASVTDPKVFRDFAAYWEEEYFKDMDALNIRRPDLLTRVSEYVPEIVTYVENIVKNGFAYESEGSVYFNTVAFGKHPNHDYAKLEPWSAGNTKLLQEGEGDLTVETKGKKNPADFALWKKSKAGEPAWPSPWGEGRPGWHIECSVMAGEALGDQLDIHTGGIDLAFPHHDNEIAQAEAHYDCKQWVNYFLHTGHLHIEGQKMSKSLKNFVTIQQALENNTAEQIRIFFLLHQWDTVLDFSSGALVEAKAIENTILNFLTTIKAVVREQSGSYVFTGAHNYGEAEKALVAKFQEKKTAIHAALADSFNTPTAMSELRDLISTSNSYYVDQSKQKNTQPNAEVLAKIAKYVTELMRMFGVFGDANPSIGNVSAGAGKGADVEETVMPYLTVLARFRDAVRELAQNKGDYKELLKLSDRLRDDDLVELGVVLDDRDDGKALVKLIDKATLLRQREEKKERELQKQREKDDRLAAAAAKRAEKLAKGKLAPADMFKTDELRKEYSEWDAQGIPTKDAAGEPLSKSRRKKVEKEHAGQAKLHEEYLADLKGQ